MPKRHAADIENDRGVEGAVYFAACLFIGRGIYLSACARTEADIRATAAAMEAQQSACARRAILTAIDAAGRAWHL